MDRRGGLVGLVLFGLVAGLVTATFGMALPGMLVSPLLFCWLRLRYGLRGTAVGVLAGALAGSVTGGTGGFVALAVWALSGTAFALGSERGWPASRSIALAAVPAGLTFVLATAAVSWPEAREAILANLEISQEGGSGLPFGVAASAEELAEAKRLVVESGRVLWPVMPSLLAVLSIVASYVVYRLGQWIFPRWGVGLVPPTPLRTWSLGPRFPWILGSGLVLVLSGADGPTALGYNVLCLAAFAYMVQGAAVLSHLLDVKRVPKGGRVLVWIGGFALLQPMSGLAAALAGLLDTWFDFRRRAEPGGA